MSSDAEPAHSLLLRNKHALGATLNEISKWALEKPAANMLRYNVLLTTRGDDYENWNPP